MRQAKIRSSSVCSTKQQNLLQQKLNTIDKHIRRIQNLPATLFMHPQLVQNIFKQQILTHTTNQLFVNQAKFYLLQGIDTIRFHFKYRVLGQDKKYILKIDPSQVELQVQLQVDGRKRVSYRVKQTKGILIDQVDWKRADFIVRVTKRQNLSTVRFIIDTIAVEHPVKVHGIPSQRKIIQKQLEQYWRTNMNKQKIAEILQKRRRKSLILSQNLNRANTSDGYSSSKSLQFRQNSRILKRQSGFNESTSLVRSNSAVLKQPKIRVTQIKRDLVQFEKSKQMYLKHIQKMDPVTSKALVQHRHQYQSKKIDTLKKVSSSVFVLHFIHQALKASILTSKNKIKQMKVNLLCKKFIRNLIAANRLRMPNHRRFKIALNINLSMISCIEWQFSHKKAEDRIIESFKSQLFKIDIEQVTNLCITYCKSVQTIKKGLLKISAIYQTRFRQLAYTGKGYKFKNQDQFKRCYAKYMKHCQKNTKNLVYGFAKFHHNIDQIMNDVTRKRNN